MMMAFSFFFFFCKGKFITYFLLWVRLFCFGFHPQNNHDAIFSLEGAHQAFSREGEGRANEIAYECAV